MSRSFHTTRKDVELAYKNAKGGDDVRVQEYHKLREQYFTKRRAKSYVKEERMLAESVLAGFSIDALPIEIEKESEYLHYPASDQDIRGLLKIMPQGLIDGLDKVTFALGNFEQRSPEQPFYGQPTKDPYFGRLGHEVAYGIYRPSCLGTYFLSKNEIKLYGYIYDPAIENRDLWDLYFRIHMLGTFVHELAHHYDFVNRVSRGRWRMDDDEKDEIYAETLAHKWVTDYIIPYIKDVYSDKLNILSEWMSDKIGVVLEISLLAGDLRATGKNGTIRIGSFFSTSDAFEEFVRNIQLGKDLTVSRIELADCLHMAEEFDLALKILDLVLKKDSKNVDAICLYGEIQEHLGNYSEAIYYGKTALQLDLHTNEAFHVLCDAFSGLEEWKKAYKWVCRGLEIAESRGQQYRLLQKKANVENELMKFDDAQETIQEIKKLWKGRALSRSMRMLETELKKKMKES